MFALRSATLVLLATLVMASGAIAGPGGKGGGGGMGEGPFQFILDHDKELDLTADQKRLLKQLQSEMQEKFKKARQDPQMATLLQQVREAKKSGDEEKIKTAAEALRAEMEKDTGTSREGTMGKIAAILNKDQLAKLKELRGEGKGPGKGMGERGKGPVDSQTVRPDPAKGPPPVFDDSKKPAPSSTSN